MRNTGDSGADSLRDVLLRANTNGTSPDVILFNITSGGPPYTINLLSPLPPIVDSVTIDASTQPGYVNRPVVELNGTSIPGNSDGLHILTSNCVVRGLAISRFLGHGINLEMGGSNVVKGNFIGTGVTGTGSSSGNSMGGVGILRSTGNLIGGTNAMDGNVLSGNWAGIYISEPSSVGNLVQGNYIGTAAGGTSPLGNSTDGIAIDHAASNFIGGIAPAMRNIISGNGNSGVHIYGSSATGNVVQGNYIGVDVTGSVALGNSVDGVTIDYAPLNFVGGTNPGAANVISRNGHHGVAIDGNSAVGNVVQGNFIGTDLTGSLSLGNSASGVALSGTSSNLIGGNTAAARNIVAGNTQSGIFLNTAANANLVQGNYIGVDATGTNPLANAFNGVSINNAGNNRIGGTEPGMRNVISGNKNGVYITGSLATGNLVQGNFIGTDATGSRAVNNAWSGVAIESSGNIIGGADAWEGNVISGNSQNGLTLLGLGAFGNQVKGNYIGTDPSGHTALGNGAAGIYIKNAPNNAIGGGIPNIISANGDAGIYITDSGASGNLIQANRIGTDVTGTISLGNALEGIFIQDASTNTIGGATPALGNQVSGNGTWGIILTNSSWSTVQNNWIGVKSDGVSPLGNTTHAVECAEGSQHNMIGGPPGTGNRIAYTRFYTGIRIRDQSANHLIRGNSIFGNGGLGIDLGNAGVTPNDPCDSDTGANMLQNFPVLNLAYSGSLIYVHGTLNSAPNQVFLVQLFSSPTCDPSGYGEGQTYLGDTTTMTDGSCTAAFSVVLPASEVSGKFITATATDAANNTSEFSACVRAAPEPILNMLQLGNQQIQFTWPTNSQGFILQQTDSLLDPIQWVPANNLPTITNGQFQVSITATNGSKFYRLHFQ